MGALGTLLSTQEARVARHDGSLPSLAITCNLPYTPITQQKHTNHEPIIIIHNNYYYLGKHSVKQSKINPTDRL